MFLLSKIYSQTVGSHYTCGLSEILSTLKPAFSGSVFTAINLVLEFYEQLKNKLLYMSYYT